MIAKLELDNHWLELAGANSVLALAGLVRAQAPNARAEMLAAVEYQINNGGRNLVEYKRVALVKLLVALAPDSWHIVRGMIQAAQGNREEAEIRFTIFCFLDEVPGLPGGGRSGGP